MAGYTTTPASNLAGQVGYIVQNGGKVGDAYNSTPNTAYLNVGNFAGKSIDKLYSADRGVTLEAWINNPAWGHLDQGRWILFRDTLFLLYLNGNSGADAYKLGAQVYGKKSDGTYAWAPLIGDGQIGNTAGWTHVAYKFDATQHSLYINGKLNKTAAHGLVSITNPSSKPIGISWSMANQWNAVCFRGLIDEVSMLNRTLSDSEILAHYNKGMVGKSICTI